MTFEELSMLASTCAVEIGIHTVSHPVLPLLSDREMQDEINVAHDALRERFDNVLPVLAVPFGLYDQRTLRMARAAGVTASLTLAGRLDNASQDGAVPRLCMTSGETCVKLAVKLLGLPEVVRRWSGRATAGMYPALPSPTT